MSVIRFAVTDFKLFSKLFTVTDASLFPFFPFAGQLSSFLGPFSEHSTELANGELQFQPFRLDLFTKLDKEIPSRNLRVWMQVFRRPHSTYQTVVQGKCSLNFLHLNGVICSNTLFSNTSALTDSLLFMVNSTCKGSRTPRLVEHFWVPILGASCSNKLFVGTLRPSQIWRELRRENHYFYSVKMRERAKSL